MEQSYHKLARPLNIMTIDIRYCTAAITRQQPTAILAVNPLLLKKYKAYAYFDGHLERTLRKNQLLKESV